MTDEVEITPRQPGESQIDYARRRAEALGIDASRFQAQVKAPAFTTYDSDLIPDVPESTNPEKLEMDRVIGDVDIVQAYIKWCGKMQPNVGNRRESIMVSCPNPAHPDKNPSAWMTLDKGDGGVGHCAQCGGFDKYDIAAWHFGYNVPGYKSKEDFPDLRRDMAQDLGYTVVESGKDQWLEKTPAENAEQQPPAVSPVAAEGSAETQSVNSGDAGDPSPPSAAPSTEDYDANTEMEKAVFDWKSNPGIREGTFLHEWLELTATSHEPEEFYFWHGLLALGSAVGNHVRLLEKHPVRPNMMLCLVGTSGSGKSISVSLLEKLLYQALPWDPGDSSGVRMISSPGSGEALLDQFVHAVTDPSDPSVRMELPVNGFYREDELATVMKRTGRAGNTSREILMGLYDRPTPVHSASRGAGTMVARNHYFQMVTTTQPSSVSDLLTQQDSGAGFLNRWVFAFGQNKPRPPIDTDPPLDLDDCSDLLRSVRAWAGRDRDVEWASQAAADRWSEFCVEKVYPAVDVEDAWIVARLPLLAKKVMLLLAINDKSTVIMEHHVEGFIALWDYLLTCYGIVDHKVSQGMDPMEACIEAIMRYLSQRDGKSFTFREITKQSGASKFPKETVRRSLDLLTNVGMIQGIKRSNSDRTLRYSYVAQEGEVKLATVTKIR